MAAAVKTLIPARPVGKELLLSSNIPFLDNNNPEAYLTRFQEDFRPFYSKKEELCHQLAPAQVVHKDLRHIKEYLTEAMVSYQKHPSHQITRIPRWTMLHTNFKMPTDPGEVAFLSTHSQNFQPHPFQPPSTAMPPTLATKKIQEAGKLPDSTTHASFITHRGFPIARAAVKHLEDGFPTIKGDRRHRSFASHYNNAFQGAWSRPAQSVEKHSSSVYMGDPVKIADRKTTHAASFGRPSVCRPPDDLVKKHVKLNLGTLPQDSWSSTSREAFRHHKLGDPVVTIKGKQNFSSLPKGDTDTQRNKERMSVTTNRVSFSDLNHTQQPVYLPEPDLMTKSHVQFSPPSLSGLYYTTTAKEHYSKKDAARARPAIHLPGNILSGREHGVSLSTTMADFLPLKICTPTPCRSRNVVRDAKMKSKIKFCDSSGDMSNLRFPLAQQHFSTTNSEDYTSKPLILQRPACNQFFTHFVLK